MGHTTPSIHSSGSFSSLQILEITKWIALANCSPPYLKSSPGNRSLPAALLFFSCLISFFTVSRSGAGNCWSAAGGPSWASKPSPCATSPLRCSLKNCCHLFNTSPLSIRRFPSASRQVLACGA
uniref:(northern house mosquito) hypothetical protein n=1 Tax=Culex pipiens TaxID=7175 RepID=A0A8D8G3Z5_CULPI